MADPNAYTDLLLRIFPYDEAHQAYPVEAEVSDGSRYTDGRFVFDRETLTRLQLDAAGYGTALFDALFAGDIRRAYDRATGAAQAETSGRLRVRIWVDTEAVELHAVPWERLYHSPSGKAVPLGASTLTPLSRYTSLEIREPQPITDLPLRMLVVVSNPSNLPGDLAPANVDLEIENIRKALTDLRRDNKVAVTVMPGHTSLSPALRERLEKEGYAIIEGPSNLFNIAPRLAQAHIFHFIGHGAFRKKGERGDGTAALYLEKSDGAWQAVKDEEIVSMLTAIGTLPHLMFLVACESAKREPGATSPFVGLGPKLVQAGVPAVVAMQEQVPVELARTLAGEFYARLAEHGEVDRALNQARLQVFDAKSTAWAIPVLFMRIRKGKLFGAEPDEEAPAPGLPPFKGLQYFNENDSDKFYGREMLTAKLVGKLRNSRFLPVIVGASGSGKSSVVRAGLVPALRRGDALADGTRPPDGSTAWLTHIFTPANHPLEALATSLTRDAESVSATRTLLEDLQVDEHTVHLFARKTLAQRPGAQRLLLIVDQFEELFTLCKDETERRAFINNLLYASAETTDGPTLVIIIFRADFYAHCSQYDNLREAVSQHQEFVGPMNRAELHRAIEEPAKQGGWEMEAGLVEVILKDVGDEPGALPLLQHALLETWKRRRGRLMTIKGYYDAGGVSGAIAKTAQTVYEALSPEHQTFARRIFLRLVELGSGTQATRRRAALAELSPQASDRPVVDTVLKILVDNRLVVTTDTQAEVAHEALIREWPTFREWIEKNREGLRLYRDLANAAREWDNLMREDGALYRGVRLVQAVEWAADNPDETDELEEEFLRLSKETVERETTEKEERQQRELKAARQIAEAAQQVAAEQARVAEIEKSRATEQERAATKQRRLSYVVGGVGLVAVILAIFAFIAFGNARSAYEQAKSAASTADAASTQAVAQGGTAVAARIEAVAQQNLAQAASTQAVEQRGLAQIAQQDALDKARESYARQLASEAQSNLAADPERSILIALQAMSLTYGYNAELLPEVLNALHHAVVESRIERTFAWPAGSIYSAAFSPDGRRMVLGGQGQAPTVYDLTGAVLFTLADYPATVSLYSLTYNPAGDLIAGARSDGFLQIWDAVTGQSLKLLAISTTGAWSLGYNAADGTRLVTSDEANVIKVWDTATWQPVQVITASVENSPVYMVALNPDGTRLAVAGKDLVTGWEVNRGTLLWTLAGHERGEAINSVTFNPSGTRLLTGSDDRTAKVWDVTGREPSLRLSLESHLGWVVDAAFSADGKAIVTASADRALHVWDLNGDTATFRATFAGHAQTGVTARFSADGAHLLSTSEDYTAKLWNAKASGSREWFTLDNFGGPVYGVTFSPDGQYFATAGRDGWARVWKTQDQTLFAAIRADEGALRGLNFSPDGAQLATGGADGIAKIWDWQNNPLSPTLTLGAHKAQLSDVVYSGDGRYLATMSRDDETINVWAASDGRLVAGPLPGRRANFSHTGEWLVTGDGGGKIVVRNTLTSAQRFTIDSQADAVNYVTFSPDDRWIASAHRNGTVHIWDSTTGEEVGPHLEHTAEIFMVKFSADNQRLVTVSADRTTRVWDTTIWQTLFVFTGHTNRVYAVTLDPTGRYLISGGADGTARGYFLNVDDLIALAHQRLTRDLTLEECEEFLGLAECPAPP